MKIKILKNSIVALFVAQPLFAQNWNGYYLGAHTGVVKSNIDEAGSAIPGGPPPQQLGIQLVILILKVPN